MARRDKDVSEDAVNAAEDRTEGRPEGRPEGDKTRAQNGEEGDDGEAKDAKDNEHETGESQTKDNKKGASHPELKRAAPDSPSAELETYEKLKRNLRALVQKKKKIDSSLEQIEEEIEEREDEYLQEASAGNVSKGFDQYTKSSQNRRKSVLSDKDRIFSQSSTSFDAEI